MFEKDNFIPPLSSHELQRQASIERSRVIQAYMRTAMRAAAKWLRVLVLRGRRFARGVAAQRRWRRDVRELQRLDDRALKDMGVHRSDMEFAVRHGLPTRGASRLNTTGTALLHVSTLLPDDAIAAHHWGE